MAQHKYKSAYQGYCQHTGVYAAILYTGRLEDGNGCFLEANSKAELKAKTIAMVKKLEGNRPIEVTVKGVAGSKIF